MDGKMWIEIIGYLGSLIVVVSMLMTSVVRLRVINTIGNLIFILYALIIRSYPVVFVDCILVAINIVHLVRLLGKRGTKRHFDLIKTDMRDAYISYLLRRGDEDIHAWFPNFFLQDADIEFVYLVCCDNAPAGLFLGRTTGAAEVEALLDYALPTYRDTSVGRFLYEKLAEEGYQTLIYRGNAPKHTAYMKKMGFEQLDGSAYVKRLEDHNTKG